MRNPTKCSCAGCNRPAEAGACFIHRPRKPIPEDALEVTVFISQKKARDLQRLAAFLHGTVEETLYFILETLPVEEVLAG